MFPWYAWYESLEVVILSQWSAGNGDSVAILHRFARLRNQKPQKVNHSKGYVSNSKQWRQTGSIERVNSPCFAGRDERWARLWPIGTQLRRWNFSEYR